MAKRRDPRSGAADAARDRVVAAPGGADGPDPAGAPDRDGSATVRSARPGGPGDSGRGAAGARDLPSALGAADAANGLGVGPDQEPPPELEGEQDEDRLIDGPAEGDRPSRLARVLGIRFRDLELLRLALTHRSVLHDVVAAGGDAVAAAVRTNERLEFLGDAMLGAIAAEYLYALDPAADEGSLTRRRVALVRAETLVRWARELNLGDYLYLGHGERPSAGARDRMLAGGFEALVGAIYLDRGYAGARRFLHRFLARDAAEIIGRAEGAANPKGRLQEVLQDRFRLSPVYRTAAAEGPHHARVFTVEVSMGSRLLGIGSGASKREAQQAAAAAALRLLAAEEAPAGGDREGAAYDMLAGSDLNGR